MSTRDTIIQLGDQLTRDKGINAFSFSDISRTLGIKNASVHYYFPTKTDLALSIIDKHSEDLAALQLSVQKKDALSKLNAFLSIYDYTRAENRICIVGSLATDLNTVDNKIKAALTLLVNRIIAWVTAILEEGKKTKQFQFSTDAHTQALLIITNMLAALQLTRVTGKKDFITIKKEVIAGLSRKRPAKSIK